MGKPRESRPRCWRQYDRERRRRTSVEPSERARWVIGLLPKLNSDTQARRKNVSKPYRVPIQILCVTILVGASCVGVLQAQDTNAQSATQQPSSPAQAPYPESGQKAADSPQGGGPQAEEPEKK